MRRPELSARLSALVPIAAFAAMLGCIFVLQPRSFSYGGLRLLLNFSMPIVLAGLAQMWVILLGDIDLGIGPFVALANCIAAAWLQDQPLLCLAAFGLCVAGYAGMGALVAWRGLPSIVVTLGASFVWTGLAVLVLPRPGGSAPDWLPLLLRSRPPLLPMPVLVAILAAIAGTVLLRSSWGVAWRGAGSNPAAMRRAGWSLVGIRAVLYGLAAVFGILAGLALTGLNTTGDANIGTPYTLLSVAAVIVGGGRFSGGIVSPVGTVLGALIMLLTGALLSFLDVSTDWQLSVEGAILIAVLALRGLFERPPA